MPPLDFYFLQNTVSKKSNVIDMESANPMPTLCTRTLNTLFYVALRQPGGVRLIFTKLTNCLSMEQFDIKNLLNCIKVASLSRHLGTSKPHLLHSSNMLAPPWKILGRTFCALNRVPTASYKSYNLARCPIFGWRRNLSYHIILSTGKDLPYSRYKSRLQFTPYLLMGLL